LHWGCCSLPVDRWQQLGISFGTRRKRSKTRQGSISHHPRTIGCPSNQASRLARVPMCAQHSFNPPRTFRVAAMTRIQSAPPRDGPAERIKSIKSRGSVRPSWTRAAQLAARELLVRKSLPDFPRLTYSYSRAKGFPHFIRYGSVRINAKRGNTVAGNMLTRRREL